MLSAALSGLLAGLAIYAGTALVLGTKKAKMLPGGAIGSAIMLSPIYISIPAAILGHVVGVLLTNVIRKRRE